MKTLVSAIALVAVSATASFAGNFSLSQAGNAEGKLWSFTHDNGGTWNFYGTSYVDNLRVELTDAQSEANRLQLIVNQQVSIQNGLQANLATAEARVATLEAQLEATPSAAEIAEANTEIRHLNAEIDALRIEVDAEIAFVDELFAEIDAKDAQISSLTAELAVANADLEAANNTIATLQNPEAAAVPNSEEVSALMTEVSNSGILGYVSMDNVEELIRTGVLVSGSSSTTIADIEAFGIDTEALQELRDIRVAAVEAGKAHSSYNGTVDAHSVNRTDSVVYDSFGNDDGLSTMFTINGRTVDLTETGADMVFTNGAAEITDWIDGFENGYNAGYEDGYADGFADGYAAGVSDSTN